MTITNKFVQSALNMPTAIKKWLRQFINNPVIMREMKVNIRLNRSYTAIGIYLALLLIITSIAYIEIADSKLLSDPVHIQAQMYELLMAITVTLVTLLWILIPVIAGGGITSEREKRTMDLLVITPLTARDLLVGKITAAFAFTALLMTLSLPAISVCILVGGATPLEIMQMVAIILVDCGLFIAISLYASAVSKNSSSAIIISYTLIIIVLVTTGIAAGLQELMNSFGGAGAVRAGGGSFSGKIVVFPFTLINPYMAIYHADSIMPLTFFNVPVSIVHVVLTLMLMRLILTGTASKVGLYDKNLLSSVRKQTLAFNTLSAVLFSLAYTSVSPGADITNQLVIALIIQWFVVVFFVPFISVWGKSGDHAAVDDGWFKLSRCFKPMSSGSLPFILLWFITSSLALALPAYFVGTAMLKLDILSLGLAYLSMLIIIFWAISRYISFMSQSTVIKKTLAYLSLSAVIFAPLFVCYELNAIKKAFGVFREVVFWWVGMPLFDASSNANAAGLIKGLIISFVIALGLIIGIIIIGRSKRIARQ